MITTRSIFILSVILIFAGCGGGGEVPSPAERMETGLDSPAEETVPPSTTVDEEEEEVLVLDRVAFSSGVRCGAPVSVEIEVVEKGRPVDIDLYPGWEVSAQWVINTETLDRGTFFTLPPEDFGAGDFIQCRVSLKHRGELMQRRSTPQIGAAPLPPVIQSSPVSIPSIPGEFRYRIRAMDPPDNYAPDPATDPPLRYELVNPPHTGIKIHNESGEITWAMTPEIIQGMESPEAVITFRITNQFNASITGSIRLTFQPR